MESEQWFTNAVGAIETRLGPDSLLEEFLSIEAQMGRDRSQGKDRTVDLDILFFDDQVIHTPVLDIPHPEMHTRLFVLAPLNEIAPDHVHPVNGQTSKQLARAAAAAGHTIEKSSWE